MKILAIDTSGNTCSIALWLEGEIKAKDILAPMQQAQRILPMLDDILRENNLQLNQLDAIGFGCGPGSFTGVRIATSVAQGLSFAANLPVIAISSLAALAQAACDDLGWKKLLVATDARIHEVYWGTYQANQHGVVELIGIEQVCSPDNVILPADPNWYGVGNAWAVYDLPYQALAVDSARTATATAVARLAKLKYEKQEWLQPGEASPVYLRNNVAEKKKN